MKEYLVFVSFEKKVKIETSVKVLANSAQEATAMINEEIVKGDHRALLSKVDRTEGIYEQFADIAETTLAYAEGIEKLEIDSDTIEA